MFEAVEEFVSTQQGDSPEFMGKAQALAIGVLRDHEPTRLYLVRIDHWFGPRWLHFAGKFTAGKHFAIGVHRTTLRVPPFIPHRVIAERVVVGPAYADTVEVRPLHIECPSSRALERQIRDIDKHAAFLWFSGDSEAQGRGAVMVYLPIELNPSVDSNLPRRDQLRNSGAFYAGFSQREINWEPAMLRGVSRTELSHLMTQGQEAAAIP